MNCVKRSTFVTESSMPKRWASPTRAKAAAQSVAPSPTAPKSSMEKKPFIELMSMVVFLMFP